MIRRRPRFPPPRRPVRTALLAVVALLVPGLPAALVVRAVAALPELR